MKFSLPLLALLPAAVYAQANLTTNGIGTTPAQRYTITAAQAQTIIAAGIASAISINVPQNIAVVDPSGLLVAFLHMDDAYPGSIDISQKKARTAVLFNGLSSGDLYASAQPGGSLYGIEETNGGLVVFGGGFPVYVNGKLIGGVGVSGGTVPQDVQVATAAVAGLAGASSVQPSS